MLDSDDLEAVHGQVIQGMDDIGKEPQVIKNNARIDPGDLCRVVWHPKRTGRLQEGLGSGQDPGEEAECRGLNI